MRPSFTGNFGIIVGGTRYMSSKSRFPVLFVALGRLGCWVSLLMASRSRFTWNLSLKEMVVLARMLNLFILLSGITPF
ncbi:hypothetical protein D3C87_1277370 [compost metagenome]